MKNLIWIASYPRSGNTWFRMMMSWLLSEGKSFDINHPKLNLIANSRTMFDALSGLRSSEMTATEIRDLRPAVYRMLSASSEEPLFLKTHDQFNFTSRQESIFPPEITYGCLYIVRNPLDVVISSAAYFGKTVDETIRDLNDPGFSLNRSLPNLIPVLEEWIGTWSRHVSGWLNSGIPVHLIRYDDMLANPRHTLTKAIDFLKLDFSTDIIDRAIEATSFPALKKAESTGGFREKRQYAGAFFHSGKAGEWKTILSPEQIRKILDDHGVTMKNIGYMFF